MISTSSSFLAAAKSNPRKCKAKIEFHWTSSVLEENVTASANDENRAALMEQVYDGNYTVLRNWAHLDGNIKANGVWNPMPSAETKTFNQSGWYGATRCDASGNFTTNPLLTVEFDPRPVFHLFVAGESNYGEYPVDFTVRLYSIDSSGPVLGHTEIVTGNTLLNWNKNISSSSLVDIERMTLEISKWSHGSRVVKIMEFYTTFIQTIEDEDITRLSLLEERVIADGSLPVGNISSNEVDIGLQNVKLGVEGSDIIDPFFPANPNSPYHELLTKNRKVVPYLGFELVDGSYEYVKLGTFWTGDWTVVEQDASCKVSARDRMEHLRLSEYKGSTLFKDTNLYDLMISVLTDAKDNIPMPDLTWVIDTELQSYEIPYAWFPKKSYFKTIKDIVTACMGQAYMNRDDVLVIEGPSALTT